MEDKNYETKTNLLSCQDVVAYLWSKCDKLSFPFKPEGSKSIETEVTYSDVSDGETLKEHYSLTGEDVKHLALKNHEEYDIDIVTFKTKNENGEVVSDGTLLVVYKAIDRYYGVFLLKGEEGHYEPKLLVKCSQKKRLFQDFPTETVLYF